MLPLVTFIQYHIILIFQENFSQYIVFFYKIFSDIFLFPPLTFQFFMLYKLLLPTGTKSHWNFLPYGAILHMTMSVFTYKSQQKSTGYGKNIEAFS